MAKGYDPNKDYSKELQRNDLTSSERAQLEQERQNKIDDKYGGKEPNMTGSNNKFSDIYHGGSSGRDDRDDPGSRLNYGGFDYTEGKGGLFGVPTINSDIKNYTQGGIKYQVGANMSRRPKLRRKVVIRNGYTVFYDRDGYATKAIKGTADYLPHDPRCWRGRQIQCVWLLDRPGDTDAGGPQADRGDSGRDRHEVHRGRGRPWR